MRTLIRTCLEVFFLVCLNQCRQLATSKLGDTTPIRDDNMALSNLDDSKASVPSPNAYLIARPTYTLS